MTGIYPVPLHPDGRRATVSDGVHTKADYLAGRARRVHRGVDILYRRHREHHRPDQVHSSRWFEMPAGVPCLATETGTVVAAGQLATGGWVALSLGGRRAVAYHHLAEVFVTAGPVVGAGTPLGLIGGSPKAGGYGLFHLHFDLATGCRLDPARLAKPGRLDGNFVDPAEYLTGLKHVSIPACESS